MANNNVCSVCLASIEHGIEVTEGESNYHWAKLLGVSETSVRRHNKHVNQGYAFRLGDGVPGLKTNKNPTNEQAEGKQTIEESSDGSKSITAIRNRPITLQDARDWIESTGDSPEDYHLAVKSIAYGGDLFSNKMSAWPKPKKKGSAAETDPIADIDPLAILADIRRWENEYGIAETGDGAFVVSLNDTQLGKDEGGGTPETLKRVGKYLIQAKLRIQELRDQGRNLGTLVIIGGGDIVEGCVIFPNQAYNIDLDRRGQINAAVAMILNVIDSLAPLFERVIVLAARGNHGENRINGNRTTLYDNDDTLVFEMAKQATDRDSLLSHVEYIIAGDEAGVVADVAGWRLATTHGDVYGKGVAGASIDKKAQNWYKNMAMKRDPIGSADVLITHHYHHDKMSDWGSCLWRQTPALDGGSKWFEQTSGEFSLPGMLTFVMTPESRYCDEAVLR